MNLVRRSLFWPKKVHFEAKIGNFLIFMLNNIYRNSYFAHENMKRNFLKVGYFSNIAEIFNTVKSARPSPTIAKIQDSFEFL